MAVFITSAAGGGSTGTSDRTVAITPGVADLIVFYCAASANTNEAPTATDDRGGTYALVTTALYKATTNAMALFVRNQFVTAAVAHTITAATGSNTSGEIVACTFSSMARTGASAVLQSKTVKNQAAGGTPAISFGSAVNTANVTLGGIANTTNPATVTGPVGWTERQDVGQARPNVGLEVVTRDSGFTSTTVTWGGTSPTEFGGIIVELDASTPVDIRFMRTPSSLDGCGVQGMFYGNRVA